MFNPHSLAHERMEANMETHVFIYMYELQEFRETTMISNPSDLILN